jgi:hypothetical protein
VAASIVIVVTQLVHLPGAERKESPYRSGRSPDWLKMKNADAPAVKREARRGLGQGEMALAQSQERDRARAHLAEADRHIAECKAHIAHQRAVIERAIRAGHPTDVAESVLDSLEESLRAFERNRRLIIDRLKEIK